jgi:Matrixin
MRTGTMRTGRGAVSIVVAITLLAGGCKLLPYWWASKQATLNVGGFGTGTNKYAYMTLGAMNAWTTVCAPLSFTWHPADSACSAGNHTDGKSCAGWGNLGQCSSAPNHGTRVFGLTSSSVNGQNHLVAADIQLNQTCLGTGVMTDALFGRTITHELGHFLGLAHEDSVPAIMGTHDNPAISQPLADDCAGVAMIYNVLH